MSRTRLNGCKPTYSILSFFWIVHAPISLGPLPISKGDMTNIRSDAYECIHKQRNSFKQYLRFHIL